MAQEKDIVLIYYEDSPMTFARIEEILTDSKPGWYHVKLLMLQEPLQVVTWILRDSYIDGDEFTMNGKKMRFELVECPEEPFETYEREERELKLVHEEESEVEEIPPENVCAPESGGAEIISFSDLKNQR